MKLAIWKRQASPKMPSSLADLLVGRRAGAPQLAGGVGMVPLFGSPTAGAEHAPPETALSLTNVRTYGTMTLRNQASRPTIVPLHMGYLQKGAQNHAMCRSWVLNANAEHTFDDACCIQAAQGGFIKDADDRFIVLPQPLRKRAFELRGQNSYGKLWTDIGRFNGSVGLKNRGHLDELKQHRQPELLRAAHQLEAVRDQTGALFFRGTEMVGIEIAPNPAFWAELHRPLVMYCYGPLKLSARNSDERLGPRLTADGLEGLDHLWARLQAVEEARRVWAREACQRLQDVRLPTHAVDRPAGHAIVDVTDGPFHGQVILRGDEPIYASLTA